MNNNKMKFTTIADQERERKKQLDRGKKFVGSCLIAAAVVFFSWQSYLGFKELGIASASLGVAVLAHLKQINIRNFFRWIISGVCLVIAVRYATVGVLLAAIGAA